MGDIIEFLGWVAFAGVLGALSNYFLKLVSRKYLKNLPRKYSNIIDAYRKFMKFMVQRHRYFGLAALAFLPVHAGIVILGSGLSLTGLAAAVALILTASLGIYGFYFKKNLRAGWLPVHRAFAFIVFLTASAHLIFKGYISF